MKHFVIGLTGASGSLLALRTIQVLLEAGHVVHLIASEQGRQVASYELEMPFDDLIQSLSHPNFHLHDNDNLFSKLASGSCPVDAMIVIPCSMGTLGKLASGIADSLLTRVADVMMKERRTLLLVPRETPLSAIHLENMLRLSHAGAHLFPPVPAFYHRPQSIAEMVDHTVGRLLRTIGVDTSLSKEWEGRP